MPEQSEHDLKMAFLRNMQSASASQMPGKRPRVKGRRDICKGQEFVPLNVHPEQVPEFRALTKAHGLTGINYQNDGRVIVTSEKHLQKYMKIRGFSDRNGINGS